MKLPSLKVSLPFIFLCWCLVGVQAHSWVLLAYPAMWAVVGLFFFGLHLLIRTPAGGVSTQPAVAADRNLQTAPVRDDSPTDHQISAPV